MNLFELFVKIGVDDSEFDKGVSKARKGFGEFSAWTVAKGQLIADSIKAGGKALIDFGKQAIEGYAEYEQLAGGAAKIFDEMSQTKILQDANDAYKELGLSANQYLSVINDVGAAFAATMGDEAGYEAAKTGLKAISDYASGTGKNVDELSQKFTLITRSTSSYQSIADQFSGILPATSAGFLEQAKAAGILSDSYTQLTEVPIDEYQAAVSKMLEQGVADLGLANNTMNEAFSTLSGSLSMAKGAWSNLVTGLADDSADLDVLIGEFVESVGAVATNLIPKIGTALNGASELVRELIPTIVQEIPVLIEENLPILAEAAVGIIQSLVDGISQNQEMLFGTIFGVVAYLAETFIGMLPQIIELGLELIVSLADGISESLPELIPTIVDVVIQIVETLIDNVDMLVDSAIAIITALADGLINALPTLLAKAPEIVGELVDSIIENAPKLLDSAFEIITKLASGLVDNFPEIVEKGREIVEKIISGIGEFFYKLTKKGKDIIDEVKSGIKQKIEDAKQWGKDLIQNFLDGITARWEALKQKVASVAQTVKDYLGFSEPKKGPLSNFHTYAPDMMNLFAKGIRDNEKVVTSQIEKSFNFGERTIKFGAEYGDGFGIASATGATLGGTSIGNVTINIDGAKYSNENSLAEAIAEALQNMTDRRAAVYA